MTLRYPAAIALTLALIFCTGGAAAKRPAPHRAAATAPAVKLDLYSRRALRRARTILQLKLLELREERLERARKAVLRRIPIDELLRTP